MTNRKRIGGPTKKPTTERLDANSATTTRPTPTARPSSAPATNSPRSKYGRRTSSATAIRKKYGIEAAQVILGHASLSPTQLYAEKDRETALEIASDMG